MNPRLAIDILREVRRNPNAAIGPEPRPPAELRHELRQMNRKQNRVDDLMQFPRVLRLWKELAKYRMNRVGQ